MPVALRSLFDVPAPAKLNLSLRVVGKRADGYHLLDSTMVLIDWADTLHFEQRGDERISRHDIGAALPADDLCLRAARALRSAAGCTQGADITLDKRVPWGAGLGGGSSDAATTLLALNILWGLEWPLERLLPIGLALGADVPFFLVGCNARARGIGEQLAPIAHRPSWYAVVQPAARLETRAVFAHPKVAARVEAARLAGFSDGTDAEDFEANDLQAAAEDLCHEVFEAVAWLAARFDGGASRMTGSGSAVFAFAGPLEKTAGVGPATSATMSVPWPSGWTGRMCRSLERHPLHGWAHR